MKKYKRHIIVGSIIIAVLVFAFWWGGDAPSLRGWNICLLYTSDAADD